MSGELEAFWRPPIPPLAMLFCCARQPITASVSGTQPQRAATGCHAVRLNNKRGIAGSGSFDFALERCQTENPVFLPLGPVGAGWHSNAAMVSSVLGNNTTFPGRFN